MKRVVITGLGTISPLGNNVDTFWGNLVAGKSGAKIITRFNPENFKTRFACEVSGFNIESYMDRKEARKMDLFSRYAIAAAEECMQDCHFSADWNLNKVGVIWATGIGGIQTFEEEVLEFGKDIKNPRFSPFFITKMIPNMAAGQISIRYGLKGVSYATASACSSSNNAIADACNYIRLGKADAILTGGSEAPVTRTAIGGFNASKALSTNNDSPETASRPFDVSRDGFVIGEGAGAVRAMLEAIKEAEIHPGEVDYINAHATSTPVGDISECKAISTVFKKSLDRIHISATKSMTGHLLGAAGAIEAIACLKAIQNNLIPPTINLENTDPGINSRLQLTPNQAVETEVNIALNNTFGFGGHIAVSAFRKYQN